MDDVDSWLTLDSTWVGPGSIPVRTLEHLYYSGLAVLAAMLIGLPLGLLIGHTGRARTLISTIAGLWRALPTLGLVILVFRLAPLSLWPVIVALVVIAIPPILLNADAAIRSVDPQIRAAARGMGMTGWEALLRVEIPLGVPLILAGIRAASGQVIATATIAAFVGLGGLGRYIIDGYASRDSGQITGGAVLIALLALAVEGAFALLNRALGVRRAPVMSATKPAGRLEGVQP